MTGEGAGQSVDFQGGLTSTGDKLYVTYQDTPYEVPDDVFKQVQQNYQASAANTTSDGSFQERCQQAADQGGFDASLCDTDPLSLVTNLDNEGDEDVEGTETVHVSGDINIEEIGNLATEAIAASPSGQFLPADQLDQLSQQFEDAVDEASFDVYSGKDDDILRRARPQHRRRRRPSRRPCSFPSAAATPTSRSASAPSTSRRRSRLRPARSRSTTCSTRSAREPAARRARGAILGSAAAAGSPTSAAAAAGGGGGGGGGSSDAYLNCVQSANTPSEIANCANETQ